ncbi:GLUT4 regulating protein TUG-domain-containing protein [Stachybotrys elegans]|uniref:GLUT4 regulating protein TUG-domain-containing protein n=1 Tax=Stachybotrys elegans TaxID=80388 RepID=A0A8K0T210_9HYPO|nr:GLUT4 regulating protein TUG-domain-containing protein [Stachybotrys elegans]
MSSHVVVIATDLRRTTVKVNPGTYLSDVLQEACKKLNLPSDKYLVKHKQKQVDLSVPFRTSGLIPGAKLELVQKSNTPSAVQVALQVPLPEGKEIPGGRLIHKFPSDLTLWKVLRQFESGVASQGKNINFTSRAVAETVDGASSGNGQLYYETPVLNIMGRELSTFLDFQKTLSQLGYNSGSVLIRLSYRKTKQTLFDAMGEISKFFADDEQVQQPDAQASIGETAKEQPAAQSEPPAEPQEATEASEPLVQEGQQSKPEEQSDAMDTDPPVTRDAFQPVHVFLAPSGDTPAAALAPASENDYTPTIAHAQLHQARLLESSRNKRLLSDRELEEKAAAEEAKIKAIKSAIIKVRFPDNTSVDWEVGHSETGAFLHSAVRHVMANDSQPFRLVLPGGKTVIRDDSSSANGLIRAYKLSGRTLVNLVWDDGVPANVRKQAFLKSNVAQQAQAIKVPEVPDVVEDEPPQPVVQQRAEKPSSGEGGEKKVPKWFKFGKK